MKRKAVYIAATVAELLRFLALVALADGLGALKGESGADRVFRYAAAPQLLFAAGFFFLWLDEERYSVYRPLLLVGKLASALAFLPLAALIAALIRMAPLQLQSPAQTAGLASYAALAELFSVAVLVFGRPGKDRSPLPPKAREDASNGPKGPDDIERVEA
jgi:hypothetical protein